MNDTKTCRKCFTVKHINDFTNDRKSRDGLNKNCKECCSKLHHSWAKKLKDERDVHIAIYNHQLSDYAHEHTFEYPKHLKTFSHYILYHNLQTNQALKNHFKWFPVTRSEVFGDEELHYNSFC
jgi:hypothetical protein